MAKRVESILPEIKSYIPEYKKVIEKISQKSLGWQIDHSLKVVISICETLLSSNPNEFKPKFNGLKTAIFLSNYIPRGKGKAPKITTTDNISLEELNSQFTRVNELLPQLNSLPSKSHFKHPLFGHLDLKDSIKFLYIHTYHHLKIMRDIHAGKS